MDFRSAKGAVESDPRRKLALGALALALLLAVSLAMDWATDRMLEGGVEEASEGSEEDAGEADGADGAAGGEVAEDGEDDGSDDEEADTAAAASDEESEEPEEAEDEEVEELAGFAVSSGGELLAGLTDTELSTLHDYLAVKAAATDGVSEGDEVAVTAVEQDEYSGAVVVVEFSSGVEMTCRFQAGDTWRIEVGQD